MERNQRIEPTTIDPARDTFEGIYARRAVKHFDPEHRLSSDEETELLEAAIQAPTGMARD